MTFKDRSFDNRFSAMGDQAEAVFEADMPLIPWLAGIIEGEGWIGFAKQRSGSHNYLYPWLVVGMTDEDVVRECHRVAGVGNVTKKNRSACIRPHWKDQWMWKVRKQAECVGVLAMIAPYMGDRRSARIVEVFDWWDTHGAMGLSGRA